MSPTPEPRRALSPLRTALFAVVVAGLVLTAANHLIELAEDAELVETSHPADRIHFSTGRDLELGPDHLGRPLNYFVYPYIEVDGRPWRGNVEKHFSYRKK